MDIWLEVELINRLVPDAKFDVVNGNEIVWLDDRERPTDSELTAELDKYNIDMKKNDLYKKLTALVDTKTEMAKAEIAQKQKLTQNQLFRYNLKYEMVIEYEESGKWEEELGWEAGLIGLSVDDFVALVKDIKNQYDNAIKTFNAMIEAFRVKLGKEIEAENFDAVELAIIGAWKLDTFATIDQVKQVLTDSGIEVD